MKILPATMLLIWSAVCVADEIVPFYEEPRHRLIYQDEMVTVLDVLIREGDTTLFHRHAEPTLYITLRRTAVRAQRLDGEWSPPGEPAWTVGDVRIDDNAGREPFVHRVNNAGDGDFRLVLVANNTPSDYEPEVDLASMMPGNLGIESEFFVQSRIDLAPGEELEWDGGKFYVTFVLVSDSHVVARNNIEWPFSWGVLRAGDVRTALGALGYKFENRGDEPATIIAVAVR